MGFSHDDTVIILLPEGPLVDLILKAARATQVKVCEAGHEIDLIAIPFFLAIIDPYLLSNDQWTALCDFHNQIQPDDTKYLLTRPSPHKEKMPKATVLKTPSVIDEKYLKLLMLRLRSAVVRKRAIHQRAERRILRLMYMLCQLETSPPMSLKAVAQEFGTSLRTIQRDLELLSMSGYPIEGPDKKGGYRFPKDFRAYSLDWPK